MIDLVKFAIAHYQEVWFQILAVVVALGGFLAAIQHLLAFIAPFTPWTWDDNLAALLGKFVANKIFQKK